MSIFKAVVDKLTLAADDSDEATAGACGFTEEEMAAAPQVVVEDVDELD